MGGMAAAREKKANVEGRASEEEAGKKRRQRAVNVEGRGKGRREDVS
jgi:hypothetical protein